MITEETVLVLGAGASMHLGFPSGVKLKEVVCKKMRKRDNGVSGLERTAVAGAAPPGIEFNDAKIEKLVRELSESGKSSVDAFLEYRTELRNIGKAAIAACMIRYENPDRLFEPHAKYGNWYEYLLEKLGTDYDTWHENKLTVLTFNYDRSLEFWLLTALNNSYGVDDKIAAKAVKALNITHLHGQLGGVHVLNEGNGFERPYSGEVDGETVRQTAECIHIIHENEDEDPIFKAARETLNAAERIIFLGFGYHDTNLRRLGVNKLESPKRVFGSGVGLSSRGCSLVQKNFSVTCEVLHEPQDTLSYLEYACPFEWAHEVHRP